MPMPVNPEITYLIHRYSTNSKASEYGTVQTFVNITKG
jgi:hypothetical protein